jgi:hypothetical protein
VEELREGDRVHSAIHGQQQTITWIGYRRVDCRRHPDPTKVWPVRVAAHAFGSDLPRRDLYVSPDHAIYLEGVLIPVKYLINGKTIVQTPVDEVTYYHVQLHRHDVVLSEGLPTESYLDIGDRDKFANGGIEVSLHPDFSSPRYPDLSSLIWEAEGCAPLVVTGPAVVAARKLLQAPAKQQQRSRTKPTTMRRA